MPTLEELRADINTAISLGDVPELQRFERELQLMDSPRALAVLKNVTGTIARVGLQFESALVDFKEAHTMFSELGDDLSVASVSVNIGIIHAECGNFPEGLARFQEALRIHKERGNTRIVANITTNIGVLLERCGDVKGALKYLQEALVMFTELGEQKLCAVVIGNVGTLHQTMGNRSIALEHFQRAYALHKELNDSAGTLQMSVNIGKTHLELGNLAEAREHVPTDMDLRLDTDDPVVVGVDLAASLDIESGDLNHAEEILNKGLSVVTKQGIKPLEQRFHELLRSVAEKRRDFDSYVEHNKVALQIQSELRDQDTVRSMAIQEKQAEIDEQHQEQMRLKSALYSALPHTIADRVVKGETVNDHFDNAAVMFVDVVGFTEAAASIPANYVVDLLDTLFSKCDDVCGDHGLTKIKTIGDSYLAVAFPLLDESAESLAKRSARAAQKILEELHNFNLSVHIDGDGFEWRENVDSVQVRIGLHSGPLVAGILGSVRLQYDVWGDTVNLASRMESLSEPGKIQTTEQFALAITNNAKPELDADGGVCLKNEEFELHLRGTLEVKGRGEVKTWWLSTRD